MFARDYGSALVLPVTRKGHAGCQAVKTGSSSCTKAAVKDQVVVHASLLQGLLVRLDTELRSSVDNLMLSGRCEDASAIAWKALEGGSQQGSRCQSNFLLPHCSFGRTRAKSALQRSHSTAYALTKLTLRTDCSQVAITPASE